MGASVGGATTPVVAYVFEHIVVSGIIPVGKTSRHTPIPTLVVGEQVVVVRTVIASDGGRISMFHVVSLLYKLGVMPGIVQRLGNERALQCDIFCIAGTERFVDRPAHRAMIHDTVIVPGHTQSVGGVGVARYSVPVVGTAEA